MKKLSVILLLVVLAACQEKKNPVRSTYAGGVATNGIKGTIACAPLAEVEGIIMDGAMTYEQGDSTGNFHDRTKSFLTSFLQPTDVGQIQKVAFAGTIKVDAAGNVLGNQSKLTVGVFDSYITGEPIKLNFSPNLAATISGQFNTQSGSGTLIVKDSYGEMHFKGTVTAQIFSGTVRYVNTQSVVESSAPTKGPLGTFSVQRCGFFQ